MIRFTTGIDVAFIDSSSSPRPSSRSVKLVAHLADEALGGAQLGDAGDHREHDAQVAVLAGAEQAAQLGSEDVGVAEAVADRAKAEGGVVLVRLHADGELVAAEVEGADGD